MLALLDYLSDEARTAFYKALLEGLLASDEVSESDKERLKNFCSITSIEVEVEREEYTYGSPSRNEILYTLYGEHKDPNGETYRLRESVIIKEDVMISIY